MGEEFIELSPERFGAARPIAPEAELIRDIGGRIELASSGMIDPTGPELPMPTREGRGFPQAWSQQPISSWTQEPQQPILEIVVVIDQDKAPAARDTLMQLGPQLTRQLASYIGESVLQGDPAQIRRFSPLAPSTIQKRRALGRGLYPLVNTGEMMRRYQNGQFMTSLAAQMMPGEFLLNVGYGPSPKDEPSPGKYADNFYGRQQRYKRARIPPRMPGMTARIREKIRQSVKTAFQQYSSILIDEPPNAQYTTLPSDGIHNSQRPFFLESGTSQSFQ